VHASRSSRRGTPGGHSSADCGAGPVVTVSGGGVRGLAVPGGYVFRGLPYAAPPAGDLRWRSPRPPAGWRGVRDATRFAPSCPQPPNPALTGPTSEDCLYLNVYTPTVRSSDEGGLPVLVWIHGGRFTLGAGRDYDGTKLAAGGLVVVTINFRLGALGFLAHPALASQPGGPSGNYGLMDQQAALRWVQSNIGQFGGDPRNVTIAGQSSGGTSVLAHLVCRGSRGLFHRAIVQSGSFALTQQSLAAAEADGEAFAARASCPDQTAGCLRRLPVADLVSNFPGAAIPGVVDGMVLEEPVGTALAAGRFARVPILNGINHDEQRDFITAAEAVNDGAYVPVSEPVTARATSG
jgi:para-nitrobenzyl esterase